MTEIAQFIRARHIDSYQKLRVLIFLYENADSSWTSPQIAARLYLADGCLLDKIIADLHTAGLVDCMTTRCKLHNEACIRLRLQHLIQIYENPLSRQKILKDIRSRNLNFYPYQESVYESC